MVGERTSAAPFTREVKGERSGAQFLEAKYAINLCRNEDARPSSTVFTSPLMQRKIPIPPTQTESNARTYERRSSNFLRSSAKSSSSANTRSFRIRRSPRCSIALQVRLCRDWQEPAPGSGSCCRVPKSLVGQNIMRSARRMGQRHECEIGFEANPLAENYQDARHVGVTWCRKVTNAVLSNGIWGAEEISAHCCQRPGRHLSFRAT